MMYTRIKQGKPTAVGLSGQGQARRSPGDHKSLDTADGQAILGREIASATARELEARRVNRVEGAGVPNAERLARGRRD